MRDSVAESPCDQNTQAPGVTSSIGTDVQDGLRACSCQRRKGAKDECTVRVKTLVLRPVLGPHTPVRGLPADVISFIEDQTSENPFSEGVDDPQSRAIGKAALRLPASRAALRVWAYGVVQISLWHIRQRRHNPDAPGRHARAL